MILQIFFNRNWDVVENIMPALKRASDANIPGLKVGYKKFPQSSTGNNYVLDQAKKFQGKASGDANLSFEVNGTSFDNIENGVLIDRKYGHATSIFKDTDPLYNEIPGLDDFIEEGAGKVLIKNQKRVNSLLTQARRQLSSIDGKDVTIEWEISSDLGARGISQVFQSAGITNIVVKYIP